LKTSTRLFYISWQVGLSCLIIWLSGQLSFTILGLSVPITLQSMFAILLPVWLNSRNAQGGILLFLFLGGPGLPVFAGGAGGISYFYSNSGGYLIGFYIISFLVGIYKRNTTNRSILAFILLFVILHLTLTAIGLTWITFFNLSEIKFETHIAPYLPGLVIKSFGGALISLLISKRNLAANV
jgi:biotin transport system substrate-specific component